MVEKVNGKSFYHVNRINKKSPSHLHSLFQVGDTYTTDVENVYWRGTFDNHPPANWRDHYIKVMEDLTDYDEIGSQNLETHKGNINIFHKYLTYYRNTLQEIFLEQIRNDQYPDHPSRKYCLWVVKRRKEAEKWMNDEWSDKSNKKQIVKFELTGTIHWCNEEYLFGETILTLDKMTEKAENYWSGKQGNMKKEILFEGKAEIISIIK